MAETDITQRVAAILAADAVGYTRLMADDEPATIAALDAARAVFVEHIEANQGRVVDTAGDSVLAVFETTAGAVRAAVAIQGRIKEINEPVPDERRMRFRIGIHLGDIHEKADGTVYGDGVNIAARLQGIADAGAIMVSDGVQGALRGRLDVGFADAGSHEIKNVAEPVHAYRVTRGGADSAPAGRRRSIRLALAAAAVVLVVAAAIGALWLTREPSLPMVTAAGVPTDDPLLAMPTGPKIAVLPFENLSGDPEQEYFADGITDTLITDLSKLPKLSVIARNSTFTYKGLPVDVREVGQTLGASHVIEGTVQRGGGNIRVNIQLIDAVSGTHLWAGRFDRPFDDIFAVQDEIVGAVILELDVELVSGEQARVWHRSTDNPEAYDIFLRAMEFQRRLTRAGVARAQQIYQEALDTDPKFAVAMRWLADTHYHQAVSGWSDSYSESLNTAERLFLQAIELDDSLGAAYAFLGLIYLARLEHEKALDYAGRSVEMTPGSAETLALASIVYIYAGLPERGLQLIENASQLEPMPLAWFAHPRAAAHIFLGEHEMAVAEYRACLKALPDFIWANVNIIIPYMELGMIDEARAQAREVLRINPRFDTATAVQVLRVKDPVIREHWQALLRQAGLP